MRRRNAIFGFLALGLSSCNLFSGKCTYELRTLEASGSVSDNGAELASVQINLSEQRGSLQGTSMHWLVTGTSLKGHVLSASLKDASDLTQVRFDLALSSAQRPEISEGAADTKLGANLGGVRDFLAAGRGVVELQTDIPSRATVTIPLTANSVGDWIRPYCS